MTATNMCSNFCGFSSSPPGGHFEFHHCRLLLSYQLSITCQIISFKKNMFEGKNKGLASEPLSAIQVNDLRHAITLKQ